MWCVEHTPLIAVHVPPKKQRNDVGSAFDALAESHAGRHGASASADAVEDDAAGKYSSNGPEPLSGACDPAHGAPQSHSTPTPAAPTRGTHVSNAHASTSSSASHAARAVAPGRGARDMKP